MKLYNTLHKQKQELHTIEPGRVRLYACGPTVYHYIHIGNARPVVVFDVLRRYLTYTGLEVCFVQNFTDVDDKIIAKANAEGRTAAEIATQYIAEYHRDASGLGVLPATIHPTVTDNIEAIIDTVKTLEKKGFAYAVDGTVYFKTTAFDSYGKLSQMPLEDLELGARIAVEEQKEHPLDFVLWKAAKPGEPSWPSPWGDGRPGWHIECTAMAQKYLGDTIDIHCGGQDLIFPHHENEIAQSEAASGKPFATFWVHNGYINIDNKKMSKSAGNFFTVREIAKRFGYEPIRFLMLQAHYRSPIQYSEEVIKQCQSALDRLYHCQKSLAFAIQNKADAAVSDSSEQTLPLEPYRDAFVRAMEDDLNTADAIAAIFDLVREINTALLCPDAYPLSALEQAQALFLELTGVLGLCDPSKQASSQTAKDDSLPAAVTALLSQRAEARANKDFATADRLRDQLLALGYTVKETRQGVMVERIG